MISLFMLKREPFLLNGLKLLDPFLKARDPHAGKLCNNVRAGQGEKEVITTFDLGTDHYFV